MERLEPAKAPMWKKSMLQNLNLDTIRENLDEISEAGDCYGYDTGSKGQYYAEYKELFDELSGGAYNLMEALFDDWNEDSIRENWDDCTVALLGRTQTVLGFDAAELDYFHITQFEETLATEEAEKRLSRLTKPQLIKLFRKVMTVLVCYMDVKGSFDTLSAVVNELDNRSAIMENGTASDNMWIE